VRAPVVKRVDRSVDATGCCNRVGANRVNLGKDRNGGASFGGCERCALSGKTCSDD
jgi:hypothetical protein